MSLIDNIRKTRDYASRNGIKAAFYAASERLRDRRMSYEYIPPDRGDLFAQKKEYEESMRSSGWLPLISILTPVYMPEYRFLAETARSVLTQTYGRWEWVVADATPDDAEKERVTRMLKWLAERDGRIRYVRLNENRGIAGNTNAALAAARGSFIGLLDHDDLLTPDALYEMWKALRESYGTGGDNASRVVMVYSDEDKFEDTAARGRWSLTGRKAPETEYVRRYFEPNIKPDFNFDHLLSNNYICHFTIFKADVLRSLGFRSRYDGAQDYDVILRAAERAVFRKDSSEDENASYEEVYRHAKEACGSVIHIPKVLYHWRTHAQSTASNPSSKRYAYDAGRAAVSDLLSVRGIKGTVSDTPHLGFYRVDYEPDILSARKDVGVVGGKVVDRKGRIIGGMIAEDGSISHYGLPEGYSGGYRHLAVIVQDAYAVDPRCMRVREELRPLYSEYGEERVTEFFDRVREMGYRIVWDPQEICVYDAETVQHGKR